MLRILFLFIPLFLTVCSGEASERGSSAPFISGDSFRVNCTFNYDELTKKMDPEAVQEGDSIFVKTDYLDEFFSTVHPRITHPYVLVTHNSDYGVPGLFAPYLDDPNILAWFGQNVDGTVHPKLHPIPIGIANRCWTHGNIELLSKMIKTTKTTPRTTLLYMNFSIGTFFDERSKVFHMFQHKPYCLVSPPKKQQEYLTDLAKCKFVLSPRGNGLDCHRTWEALLMGAIPIVKTSPLDPLFENLPVLIVNDWEELDEGLLESFYDLAASSSFQMEKMYVQYWIDLIHSYKK